MEIVSTIIHQLTRCLTPEQIKAQGFDTYFVDHTTGVYPQAASGMPFSTSTLQVTGDAVADLFEDLAAEQKARLTYDNILRLVDSAEVKDPIRFLREREIVHFQRFGESLRIVQDGLNSKNFYAFNPSFDKCCNPPDKIYTPGMEPIPTPAADVSKCGCGTASSCTPSIPTPAVPSCGCSPAPAASCGCNSTPAVPASGLGCAPAAVPYAMPYNMPYTKRNNRSCGCG